MMNKAKVLIAGSILAASTVASSVAVAESPLTGNIGFTSNYLWRGVTQNNDEAAIQGGIDYAHDSGFYVGTWISSLSADQTGATASTQYEQDWYLGYSFDAGPVGLDVGYITYTYPVGDAQLDFDEVYVNASFQNFGAGVAYTVDKEDASITEDNDLYVYVSAEFEVKKDLTLGVLVGDVDVDGTSVPTADYTHYQLSLSKNDFVFAYDDNDKPGAAGDPRVSVSYSKSFDL